jgi:hypothetical protein
MKVAIPSKQSTVQGDTVETAVREGRCLKPTAGCGRVIALTQDDQGRRMPSYAFPHESYKKRWLLTGLCASCQDQATLREDGDTVIRGMD